MSEINLIPYELKRGKGKVLNTRDMIITLIAALVIVLGAVVYPLVSYTMLQSKEKKLAEEITANHSVLEESDQLSKSIASYGGYIAMVDTIVKFSPKVAGRVRGLEMLMAKDVKFTSFTLGNAASTAGFGIASTGSGTLTISAAAQNYLSIVDSAANMQESKDYKDARISSITYNKGKSNYTFSININY